MNPTGTKKPKKMNLGLKLHDRGGFGKVYKSVAYPDNVFKIVYNKHANLNKLKWFQEKSKLQVKLQQKSFFIMKS